MRRCDLARRTESREGFSLLEALVALAIASLILAAIATLGAQVLRNWSRGQDTIAAIEMLTRGLGRLTTDLSLAIPLRPPGSEEPGLLFQGDANSLLFPAATGLGAGNRGVELLSMSVAADPAGAALIRRRGPVANLGTVMADPVALLRGKMSLSFSYRDRAGVVSDAWAARNELPAAVLVDIRGASGASLFPAAFVIPLQSDVSVECLPSESGDTDDDEEEICGPTAGQDSASTTRQRNDAQ